MRSGPIKSAFRLLTTGLLLAAVAVGGYWAYENYTVPQVSITRVVRGPVVEAFYATGTLVPHREYPVRSNLEGTLTQVLVEKGAVVCKDQRLAVVVVEEDQLRFQKAKAELEYHKKLADPATSPTVLEFDSKIKAANEVLEIAKRELARTEEMRKVGAVSPMDLDRAAKTVQDDWSQLEALNKQRATRLIELARDVDVAKADLDIAQWRLDQANIVSPTDGQVLDWPVSVGTRVKVNDHLMQIADVAPKSLTMRAQVDEENKTSLRVGQNVKVALYAYPGKKFEGRVVTVYPQADSDRRTFEVDVAIEPPDPGFSAGMTGELAFIIQTKENAPVVPSQAVRGDNLWVVRDGRVRKLIVEVGIKSVERTEIIHGLAPDDRVVISPPDGLSVGQRVRLTEVDPIDAANLNKPKNGPSFAEFK